MKVIQITCKRELDGIKSFKENYKKFIQKLPRHLFFRELYVPRSVTAIFCWAGSPVELV